jgi:tRNA pseudouridine32 synthase/23S rRNA pseudouridine746 synthase
MIVHRLDYATSGVVVFARNHNALKELHTQFRRKHNIYKRYSAVVQGKISLSTEGEIDLPLGKDPIRGPPLCRVDTEFGKGSKTLWTLQERGRESSYVHLRPITGRLGD